MVFMSRCQVTPTLMLRLSIHRSCHLPLGSHRVLRYQVIQMSIPSPSIRQPCHLLPVSHRTFACHGPRPLLVICPRLRRQWTRPFCRHLVLVVLPILAHRSHPICQRLPSLMQRWPLPLSFRFHLRDLSHGRPPSLRALLLICTILRRGPTGLARPSFCQNPERQRTYHPSRRPLHGSCN